MPSKWQGVPPDWSAPAVKAVSVTAADSDLATVPCRAVYVGTGGNVALMLADDSAAVIFTNVPDGTLLPFACKQIRSTSTTASGLVAVY
jgi:hypothetical protein